MFFGGPGPVELVDLVWWRGYGCSRLLSLRMSFELAPCNLAFQRHQIDGRYLLWDFLLATVP